MAAMGAEPKWLMLSLTLPEYEARWLECFAGSFNQLAKEHSTILIGGDLSRGPLSITVQIQGTVPKSTLSRGAALRREGAQSGDMIYVTGELGAAAYALKSIHNNKTPSQSDMLRLNRPQARIETGIALRGIATSCIDISDGLVSDLGYILKSQ